MGKSNLGSLESQKMKVGGREKFTPLHGKGSAGKRPKVKFSGSVKISPYIYKATPFRKENFFKISLTQLRFVSWNFEKIFTTSGGAAKVKIFPHYTVAGFNLRQHYTLE